MMIIWIRAHGRYPAVLALSLLALFGLVQVVLSGNIDPVNKWAWGTNVGWINFSPSCDGCVGVTVYRDHLEGYAWGENIGWIRMGSYEGGGARTYANSSAANYGVNIDAAGNLSGYAWATNVGWINVDPANGGVSIDMTNGEFDGYAWGENIGWIRFKGTAANMVEYKVVARRYGVYLPLVVR